MSKTPILQLKTALGDVLKFRSFTAKEELGRLFEFSVLAVANFDDPVDPAALLGTNATVSMTLGNGSKRHFHGIVVRAGMESAQGKLLGWRLQVRPWLWRLTRRSDSRVFQDQTAVDIIKKVFEKYPGTTDWQVKGAPAKRTYCVQYRETDFNFVSRLMEEEGIYYFFRHEENNHTLVTCNTPGTHQPFPGYAQMKFRETQDQLTDLEAITDWRHAHELTTGKVVLADYNFETPASPMRVDKSSVHKTAPALLEHYDYPGLFPDDGRGKQLVELRQQELDARVLRISGHTTTIAALATGFRFTLQEHPLASENVEHRVISTHIDAQFAGYESGQGETMFSCRFSAMRDTHLFRPDRVTPKPIVPGPQTAVVVGSPADPEIHTDKHGRVRVQFHWDRLNKKNDDSSCWIRVATPLAGKAWGMIALPRVGHEVVVDFLEGDPDQPLVTGAVYNGVNVAPYTLPDHKTVSTWRSQSTTGGTTANANELRFEDKKGDEYVWFQAEKDYNHLVKHNSKTHIKGSEGRIVGGNLTELVGGKHLSTVNGDQSLQIDGNHQINVNGKTTLSFVGPATVWANDLLVEASKTNVNLSQLDLVVSGPVKQTTSATLDIKAMKIAIEASAQLSLKVGGNFVDINPAGVFINGTLVLINSGGAAASAAEAENKDPSKDPAPDKPAAPKDPLTPAA